MRGKTLGEARDELVKAGVAGETLKKILPHKVEKHLFVFDDPLPMLLTLCFWH